MGLKFVSEKALREQFWKMYRYRKNIISYQFECPARHGNMDLVTIERVKDSDGNGTHIEFCAWEFKLEDINKAFSQAQENSEWCHKSFIVVPSYKKDVIMDHYAAYFEKYPNIGVVCQNHPDDNGGRWQIVHKCRTKSDDQLHLNQTLLKVCCKQTL